jgi:hypothetical protein
MMEAVRTSETSADNHSTWQYNPEDSSEHHTRRRENLKSHMLLKFFVKATMICCCHFQTLPRFVSNFWLHLYLILHCILVMVLI